MVRHGPVCFLLERLIDIAACIIVMVYVGDVLLILRDMILKTKAMDIMSLMSFLVYAAVCMHLMLMFRPVIALLLSRMATVDDDSGEKMCEVVYRRDEASGFGFTAYEGMEKDSIVYVLCALTREINMMDPSKSSGPVCQDENECTQGNDKDKAADVSSKEDRPATPNGHCGSDSEASGAGTESLIVEEENKEEIKQK